MKDTHTQTDTRNDYCMPQGSANRGITIEIPYSMDHEKQVRSLTSKAIRSNSRETIATQLATANLSMYFAKSNVHVHKIQNGGH